MLKDVHKDLADIIVAYFKKTDSNPVEPETVVSYATNGDKGHTNEGVRYMLALLCNKGILIREANLFALNSQPVLIL